MPIQQDKEIIASEVNTKLNMPDFLKQNQEITVQKLIDKFGQANITAAKITVNSLITPKQINDIQVSGIPGTGGLDGTFDNQSFEEAITSGAIIPVIDENTGNWELRIISPGTHTLIFSNFGTKGPNIDYFLVGGGGGGATKNYGGGGGYTLTKKNQHLALGTNYKLTIGKGGEVAKKGEASEGFGSAAKGGEPGFLGKATVVEWETKPTQGGANLYYYTGSDYQMKEWSGHYDTSNGKTQTIGYIPLDPNDPTSYPLNGTIVKEGVPLPTLRGSKGWPNHVYGQVISFVKATHDDSTGKVGTGQNTPIGIFENSAANLKVSGLFSADIDYGCGGNINSNGKQGIIILRNAR